MKLQITEIGKHVKTLKSLILRSRYVAARQANAEMLKLYFAIGAYVSEQSRKGKWGSGVIEVISEQLSRELPGLRGFSARNMRYMRDFFEEWASRPILQPLVAKLGSEQSVNRQTSLMEGAQSLLAETIEAEDATEGK